MSTRTRVVNGIRFNLNFVASEGIVEIERGDRYCGSIPGDNPEELDKFLEELSKRDIDNQE